jgi:nitrous oxidase accessory protein
MKEKDWKIEAALLLTTVSMLSVACLPAIPSSQLPGKTWYVDDSGGADFTKIQDAVDAASDGDTIYVYSGFYHESVNIDKFLILTGENKETTIIDYNSSVSVVNISADGIEMDGFTVQKSDYAYNYVIEILANNSIISDNILSNIGYGTCFGIYISALRNNNRIENNIFVKTGLGFDTEELGQNIVVDNVVNGKPLVYLDGAHDLILEEAAGQIVLINCQDIKVKNQELLDTATGLYIVNTNKCEISGCIIESNSYGIRITNSDSLTITHNRIKSNTDGIFARQCNQWQISNNSVYSNSQAIYIESSENCRILSNNLYGNGFCLMFYFADLSVIKRNNFGDNLINVNSYFSSLNSWNGNYWDRPRLLPKPILEFPRINFDWYPAKEPYEIAEV